MKLAVLPPHRAPRPAKPARPDATLPMFAAAFFLGVVVAAAALLGVQAGRGDTIPARDHQSTVAELAAARAARDAAAGQLAEQGDALGAANTLARRLVDALGSAPVSAAELARLRREVSRQSVTIERVRVVRVPVPGPVVTVTAAPAARQPQPASPAPVSTAPTPQPQRCTVAVLGACLAR